MPVWRPRNAIPQGRARTRTALPLSWRPACMTPDELDDWRGDDDVAQGLRPCTDCPTWWARERLAEGMCNGEAGEGAE